MLAAVGELVVDDGAGLGLGEPHVLAGLDQGLNLGPQGLADAVDLGHPAGPHQCGEVALVLEDGPGRGLISVCAAGEQGVTAILERP